MTSEIKRDIWCDGCGVMMIDSSVKKDLISKTMRPTVECKMCRKWEWDVR
jgi:hypothetical protein|tara:strand:+ start:95 stop:244 length:150 start_codon:yes stop_codon:yes gene_type:complete